MKISFNFLWFECNLLLLKKCDHSKHSMWERSTENHTVTVAHLLKHLFFSIRTNKCNCKVKSTVSLRVDIVGYQIYSQLQWRVYIFALLRPTLGKGTCWTISTAAALLPSEYSRKHLLFPEPGSSVAAVIYCQCMLVVFDSTLVSELPHVTQCVNVNRA